MNDIPRRCRIDLYSQSELAIRKAMLAVEEEGADPLLTEAINLLELAKNKVADYIDSKNQYRQLELPFKD